MTYDKQALEALLVRVRSRVQSSLTAPLNPLFI